MARYIAGMTVAQPDLHRKSLNLRIGADEHVLIERAAKLTGKTRTGFVLDAARRAATDALLDRSLFIADADAVAAFQARLDEPPHPNERLRHTMQARPPWA